MDDKERVEAVEQALRVTRGLAAELGAMEPVAVGSQELAATFDRYGFISDLVIAPTALADYTHIDLEDKITDVLRGGNAQLGEAIMAAVTRFWGPNSSWQELPGLADDF